MHLDRTSWLYKYYSENISTIFLCYNKRGTNFNTVIIF